MRTLVAREGLQDEIELDSAGTGSWHVGSPPDARAAATALTHGVALEGRARQLRRSDFEDFDVLLAMDSANMRELRQLAQGSHERAKVRLLREFDPASADTGDVDVPDPYYGGDGGFERVFEMVSAACEGLLAQIGAGQLR